MKKSPKRPKGLPVDNTTMVIKVAGQEYCVTNRTKKHNKCHSLGSLSDFNLEIETTKIDKDFYNNTNNNEKIEIEESGGSNEPSQNFNLAKSKSEGNPFQHKKRGKIIKVAQRANSRGKQHVCPPVAYFSNFFCVLKNDINTCFCMLCPRLPVSMHQSASLNSRWG